MKSFYNIMELSCKGFEHELMALFIAILKHLVIIMVWLILLTL